LTLEELRELRASGMTFGEIAEAQGLTHEDIEQAKKEYRAHFFMKNAHEKLEQMVTDGELTREQANRKLATMQERIDNKFNGEDPTILPVPAPVE
jgi:uncharacterized protein (DUF433 family)